MKRDTIEYLKREYMEEIEKQMDKREHLSRAIPNGKLYKALKSEIEESQVSCVAMDELIFNHKAK